MANPWFRFYSEFQDDPKVQMMPMEMRYHFVMLLCSRCKTDALSDSVIAFQWRMQIAEVVPIKKALVAAGLIDNSWKVTAWDKRQFVSDSSTDRVNKYRKNLRETPKQRYRNVSETPNETHQNRTEQSTEEVLSAKDYGFDVKY